MDSLLKQFREITTLLQDKTSVIDFERVEIENKLPFEKVANKLSQIVQSNIYIVDPKGRLMGVCELYDMQSDRMKEYVNQNQFPRHYMDYISQINSVISNIGLDNDFTIFPIEDRGVVNDSNTTIIPLFVSGKRLGYIILGRRGKAFESADLLLAEYSATVVGLELLYFTMNREREVEREKENIHMAISSLSYSEKKAIACIFNAIDTTEIYITASKIADEYHITRSVIVNALRKLESAGLLHSQSMGVKGTYIELKSDTILKALIALGEK